MKKQPISLIGCKTPISHDLTPDLHVLYGIDGRQNLAETILDNLEGYKSSRPVRTGNGAAEQFQLDIYGEILTSVYLYFKNGGKLESQSQLKEEAGGRLAAIPKAGAKSHPALE